MEDEEGRKGQAGTICQAKATDPWGLLVVLSMSLCICMLGMGIVNPLLPIYAVRLGAGGAFLGAIFGAFSVSRLIATFFSGAMADRFSRRTLIIGGLCLYALASVGYTMADKAWHLMAVRLLNGVGSAFVIPIAMAIGAEVAPAGQEGRFFGTMQMATFLGIGLGPLLSGMAYDRWGIKAPFLVMTAMCLLALVATIVKVPRGSGDSKRGGELPLWKSMSVIVRDHVLSRVLCYQVATALGRGMAMLLMPILASQRGLSVSDIGYLIAGVSISSALLQRASGYLADRIPKHYLAIASCLLSALALVLVPLPTTFWSFMAVALFYGGANAVGTPATLAFVTHRSTLFGSGASMGAYNIAFGIGMATGPILGGALEAQGYVREVTITAAVGLALVSLLFRRASLGETIPAPGELESHEASLVREQKLS